MLLREYEYRFLAGRDSQVFRIEEILSAAGWPGRFRLRVPKTSRWEARTFYGDHAGEVAAKAAEFLSTHLRGKALKALKQHAG